jgi:hypothetical protein
MSYTATSHQQKSVDRLRRMLALSSTFQLLCGVDDEAGALRRIFILEAEGECLPRAAVMGGAMAARRVAGGGASWQRPRSRLFLSVDIAPDETLDVDDRRLKGFDQLCTIFNDICDLAGVDEVGQEESHLNFVDAEIESFGEVLPENQPSAGLFYFMECSFGISDGD